MIKGAQYVYKNQITLMSYVDIPFSTENTVLAPLVARTLPVDEHIRKHISSLLKILEGSVIVSSPLHTLALHRITL